MRFPLSMSEVSSGPLLDRVEDKPEPLGRWCEHTHLLPPPRSLHLFRPEPAARYAHIDGLFTGAIDWALIEAHLPDMLRVALSIRARRLLPSAILRRLATYSRKNRLYFAFRELGRAVRTDFLLRYLSSVELRRVIQAATNKSEHFNRYAQWVSFGNSGLAMAAERDEQRKAIKYNHLVANLLIVHTVVGMTNALENLAMGGHRLAISDGSLGRSQPLSDRPHQPVRRLRPRSQHTARAAALHAPN